MPHSSQYRFELLPAGDEQAAADLVEQTFRLQVAPQYPDQGVAEFMSYVSAQAIVRRLAAGNIMLVAYGPQGLAGVIEADTSRGHIFWFFVAPERQGQGLGQELMKRAVAELKQRKPDLVKVTVNSSPNAVGAYASLGFFATNYQQEHNGISFTPMILHLV